jgi:hypothetical protein
LGAVVAVRRGNRQRTNTFLRARVLLQGITVLGMLGGSMFLSSQKKQQHSEK